MTFPEILQLGYQIALAALTTCVLLAGSGQMKRTIIAVFAVFVAAWLLRGWWPTETYSYAMIPINAFAAWIILYHPAGKWQSVVGLTYVLQIGVHIGRLLNGDKADIFTFWAGLSGLAVLQLLLIGGWLAGDKLGHLFWRRGDHKVPAKTRLSGVD